MVRKYEKARGVHLFVQAWLKGTEDELDEAFRKEASREVGEMSRWVDYQKAEDPAGVLWDYEERLFPMIRMAAKYRTRIYNRNKIASELRERSLTLDPEDGAEIARMQEEWMKLRDEQIALCWRIKRIHIRVTREVRLDLAEDEKDPFEEYEYDPEYS